MSFFTKFMKKNDSDVLDAASTVACIGKLADDLRVDSEERLKMLRRGLINFPELVAALPPVDDEEDLFEVTESNKHEEVNSCLSDNLTEYHVKRKHYAISVLLSKNKIRNKGLSITNILYVSKELGYIDGIIYPYHDRDISVTRKGHDYFVVTDAGNIHMYEDNFIEFISAVENYNRKIKFDDEGCDGRSHDCYTSLLNTFNLKRIKLNDVFLPLLEDNGYVKKNGRSFRYGGCIITDKGVNYVDKDINGNLRWYTDTFLDLYNEVTSSK